MKILVIDDDEELALLLKMRLEDHGHRVDISFNGIEGCSLALDHPYNVIILDLMLPGMNGKEICAEIREHEIDTPLIMISALDSREEISNGKLSGMDEFFVKPFRFEAMFDAINRLGNTKHQSEHA